MRPVASSRLEINAAAIRHNVARLQEAFAPARLCMVAKSNAYGHGYGTTIPAAYEAGVRDFAVFSAAEAAVVQRLAPDAATQIMGHQKTEDLPGIAAAGIQVWANDPDDVSDLLGRRDDGPAIGVHVEVETGMYRTGLDPSNAVQQAIAMAESDRTELVGLCTHLAGAEDPANDGRIADQVAVFEGVRDRLLEVGLRPQCHVSSSSAGLRWPERRFDMVRSGIATYGMWPTPAVEKELRAKHTKLDLRPALSWHSWVMSVKDVPAGARIGYGSSFCTTEPMRMAIIPVGYGDGLARVLSSGGEVLIRGNRCPIIGQINMNMVQTMVSDPAISPGDPVVLIGKQQDETIGVRSFADWNESVNYELMARLSHEIPRIAVDQILDAAAPEAA